MSLRKSFGFPYKGDIMQKEIARMKELAVILNDASRVYYQGKDEIMSNFEYDKLYDELSELENILSGGETPEEKYEAREVAEFISHFLKTKSLTKRVIFVKRYWYSDSISKIAKDYKFSESKVKSILMRLRNELKIYLERQGIRL